MTTATCQCARGVTTPETCIDRLRNTGKHGVRFFYREITGRFKLFKSSVEGVEQIATADSRAFAILIVEALNQQQPAS